MKNQFKMVKKWGNINFFQAKFLGFDGKKVGKYKNFFRLKSGEI